MSANRPAPRVPFFHRLMAAGGVALVLVLATLTASPDLHQLLHSHGDGGADDGCAVVQFAHGVSVAAGTVTVASTPVVWHETARRAADVIFVASPRYRLQPERGPPLS